MPYDYSTEDPVWKYIDKHDKEWLDLRLTGIGIDAATEVMREDG